MWFSHTLLTGFSSVVARLCRCLADVLERADVLGFSGYLLPWRWRPPASNITTHSQKSIGLRGEAKIVLTSYYKTPCCMSKPRCCVTHWLQRMQMYLWVCLPYVGTHALLPQLLFQRCQATFLSQHAAVPPAERRIHINQLCVAVLAGWRPRHELPSRDLTSWGELWGATQRASKTWETEKHPGVKGPQWRKGRFEVVPWGRTDQ